MEYLLACIFLGTLGGISAGLCHWFDRLLNEEDNLEKKRECGKKRI